jgi:hypothetical protein
MWSKDMTRIVLITLLTLLTGSVTADVLILDEVRQASRMNLPTNGQTMEQVEAKLGSPQKRHQAVGDPPITRWDYDRYSIYFEHDRVLSAVLRAGEVIERG